MKNKLLSIFAALAVAVGMSACQAGETGQDIQSSEAVSSTTLASESTQTSETTTSYDPYDYPAYPLPEGWTFEKICNLFEIDGVPLSLEFTDRYFENCSEKVEVKSDDFVNNFYHSIYFNNEQVATVGKYEDENNISVLHVGYAYDNQEIANSVTFAGYNLTEVEAIYDYLDENFIVSYENDSTKARRYVYENDNSSLILEILNYSECSPQGLSMTLKIE